METLRMWRYIYAIIPGAARSSLFSSKFGQILSDFVTRIDMLKNTTNIQGNDVDVNFQITEQQQKLWTQTTAS